MVVSNDQRDDGGSGDSGEWSGHVPLAYLSRQHPEDYQAVVELIYECGGDFVRDLTSKDWNCSSTYIQDVITFNDSGECAVLHDYLRREATTFPRGLFAFSTDGDHIHILHSCAFASRMCKCRWRSNLPYRNQLKRGYPGRKPMGELRRLDWLNVILYFFLRKRGPKEVWIDRKAYGLEDHLNVLRLEQLWQGLRSILERDGIQSGHAISKRSGNFEDVPLDGTSEDPSTQGTGGKRSRTVGGTRKKGVWELVQEEVSRLINNTAITPLSAIMNTKDFLNNPLLTNPKNQCYVNAAIDIISLKYNNLTLREFEKMYNSADCPSNLKFGVGMNYFPDHEDSFRIVDDLLRFQFNDNDVAISDFLQKLVDVIDKQPVRASGRKINIKNNTLVVVSPQSAGKTFFFDMIFDLLVSKGKLTTLNRNCKFGFEDAYSKRILEWNEPNYASDKTNYLKEFFEGKDTMVDRKGIKEGHCFRTPIIVTCNDQPPFMYDPIFVDRIVRFEWKTAPFLKPIQYKPYPLTFFRILNKYNIEW